ncbi:MAG: SpoIIE family protein phosphatase, partial [Candidatus Eremiobacteraeota bacterium]|nr:SpoIIE family protein phosphatase [Candidatus Eremiobacteraeota bacterium]
MHVGQGLGSPAPDFVALAEAVPVIMWSANAVGAREWHNRQYYDYTGLTLSEARGKGWQSAYHPEDLPEVLRLWEVSLANGTPFETEFRLRDSHGIYRWFLVRALPVRDDTGTIVRWYGVNIEVHRQKSALVEVLKIAETLQRAYLPRQFPLRPDVRFDAIYLPAERPALIGGDWYDAEELPSGSICISVGDVSGHGIAASIVAGRTRQAILTLAAEYEDPARVLSKVNRATIARAEPYIATAAVGILKKDLSSMVYALAGHPPPLLARAADGSVEALQLGGIPLGVMADLKAVNRDVALAAGDLLAFYTDGLIESKKDALQGIERLREALSRMSACQDDHGLAERVLRGV